LQLLVKKEKIFQLLAEGEATATEDSKKNRLMKLKEDTKQDDAPKNLHYSKELL
jgi:hypothetical protein